MSILIAAITIFAIFLSLMILDYLWLGIITKDFIIRQFGSLVKVKNRSIEIKLIFGLMAWLIIAIGCYIFAVNPSNTLGESALMGAVFGFIAYAIYDFTNLAFIKKYPLTFAFIDISWGTFLCSTISIAGFLVRELFLR